jgi:hypothetical protein
MKKIILKRLSALILKETGWHLIESLPEEPIKCNLTQQDQCEDSSEFRNHRYVCKCRAKEIDHELALSQAIANAIPIQNQDYAEISAAFTMARIEQDKIYPVEVSWERKKSCDFCQCFDGSRDDCEEYKEVAILHPPKLKKRI